MVASFFWLCLPDPGLSPHSATRTILPERFKSRAINPNKLRNCAPKWKMGKWLVIKEQKIVIAFCEVQFPYPSGEEYKS